MFCFKCGASMPDQSAVCPRCGAAVKDTPQPSASPAAPEAAPAPVSPWLNVPPAQPYAGAQQTDGKAVGSLILGILAIFPLGLLAGIPAVIFGHLSRKSIRESMGRLKGDGMALAGLIMGYISVATVPLILIVAAIAIPNLLRARMMANESAAANTVRILNTAEITYSTTYPAAGYARDLAALGPGPSGACAGEGTQEHACLIEATLGCSSASGCTKYGYQFKVAATCGDGGACTDYVVVAVPLRPGNSGTKSFCSTSDAVIRAQAGGSILASLTADECQSWPPVM